MHGPFETKLPFGHKNCADAVDMVKIAMTNTAYVKFLNFMDAFRCFPRSYLRKQYYLSARGYLFASTRREGE